MNREPVEPTKRRAMTKKRRLEVFMKSNGRCARCDCKLGPDFEADHIISLFLGGADEIENLEALCYDCHRRKKTPADAKAHSKVKRIEARLNGTRRARKPIPSQGFQKPTGGYQWPKRPFPKKER